jgi:chromosome partitioning protein
MKSVSVVNQKGGVAKTTTTINLGACLAQRGYRTLLIDLDPQANLTLGIGGRWDDLPYGLDQVLENPSGSPLTGVLRRVGSLPLFVAPGSHALARCEGSLSGKPDAAARLRRALQDVERLGLFEWVLIDCPPSLGLLTQNALVASSHLIVPTEAKMYAFAGMDTLNTLLADLSRVYTLRLELLGVLITLYERTTRLHRSIAEVIRDRFGATVFETIIPRNVRISEAELEGLPVVLFDPSAPGARGYSLVVDEILQRVEGGRELP